MAQRRSAGTALDYARELVPGVKANCWALAEAAGHSHTGQSRQFRNTPEPWIYRFAIRHPV